MVVWGYPCESKSSPAQYSNPLHEGVFYYVYMIYDLRIILILGFIRMQKLFLLFFIGINFFNITHSQDLKNTVHITLHSELTGLWQDSAVQKNNKACSAYYNFKDNILLIKEGNELAIGDYQYEPLMDAAKKSGVLMVQMKYNNKQPDCQGVNIDQTGDVFELLIKWKNANIIELCAVDEPKQCIASLKRVLP